MDYHSKTESISSILSELDLAGPYRQRYYVQHMESRFGKNGSRFLDKIDEALSGEFSSAVWSELYDLQNSDAQMSLYVTSHSNTPYYRAILEFLDSSQQPAPGSFVELGCNNGLLCLAIRKLWAHSKGIGVDVSIRSISVANQLASKYRTDGIEFHQIDLREKGATIQIEPSDLAIAPFLFHELMDEDQIAWERIANNIRTLLKPGGKLISINRFPDSENQTKQLCEILQIFGFIPISQQTLYADDESFPIIEFCS